MITDARVSWRHAVLRLEEGRWVLADRASTNGTYAGGQRVDRIEIDGECQVRLGHPADGPTLSCSVTGAAPPGEPGLRPWAISRAGGPDSGRSPPTTTLRIGRAPDNDIVVSDPGVSHYHAELRSEAGTYRLVDLDSRNGTFVNEQRVTAALLSEGDLVGVGSSTFRLAGGELTEIAQPSVHGERAPPPPPHRPPPMTATATATARSRSRTRFAGWCRGASGSRTSTS